MRPLRHPSIQTAVDRITPLYDCVLVERIPEPVNSSMVQRPERWQNPEEGLRTGRVVAVGRGDVCTSEDTSNCNIISKIRMIDGKQADWTTSARHAMNVKPGDVVIYPRVPANDVVIDGRAYTFLREEQHVLAVLDEAT
jgi:co-chaperonin GroES (HSP10)